MPRFLSVTPENIKKDFGFMIFSVGIERNQWHLVGLRLHDKKKLGYFFIQALKIYIFRLSEQQLQKKEDDHLLPIV